MANYFVDSTTGDDGDDGTTMDLAWATVKHAVEIGADLVAGDFVWVRRLHDEVASSSYAVGFQGSGQSLIHLMGWPRAVDASITEADWTNGSTTVDTIVGLSMSREKHLGRYITGPDGNDYVITRIIDSDTIIIDREYPNSTVTTTDGACTIQADTDWVDNMGAEYGFDDSAWTIKETAWDADADDLAKIDFSGGAYNFRHNTDPYWYYANLDLVGGTSSPWSCTGAHIVADGILTHTTLSSGMTFFYGYISFTRLVCTGNETGTGQRLMQVTGAHLVLKDSAIYGAGDFGLLLTSGYVELDNVNIGVEIANGDDDIAISYNGIVVGKDVKLGAGVGPFQPQGGDSLVTIENYGKVLGAHKQFTNAGEITKVDVVAESGDPEKRSSGADSVIEILHPDLFYRPGDERNNAFISVFEHEFEVDDLQKSYRYYVQAEDAITADELWIELEYVSHYDDTSKYTMIKVISNDAVSARSGASDWSQYIEINNITPAVASKVRIKLFCRYSHATNKIYVDPQARVS